MTTTRFQTDPTGFIRDFFTDFTEAALEVDVDPAEVVDRFHTLDVLEVADGVAIDRDRLIAHLRPIRRNLQEYSIHVHETLVQGERLAARFTIRAVMRGRPVDIEVAFFGQFTADGRLRRAHQVTRRTS
ncbi:nuclear transport factor 2 family protein [Nocardioides sp.]|uniref:nuclear transport factor 2 family protein n=1 Tax=Nocardioides sp. TaxID=35761 RepID=UPI00273638CF|nr:nuclear transport factor 2 family protein [Nocardioides sp.]MDP3894302.1 nuclear transport factor 2 family protein [Nocardioides sp.]